MKRRPPSGSHSSRRDWLIGAGVSALITLIFGLVNWHWLQVNVVTYGWDRMDHLITTLVFNNMLAAPGPTTLYDLLAYASYYPPLVHYVAAAAYQIFGVSEEIAVMTNLLYLFVLLLATWAIARRLSNAASEATTACVAALILATFPMIFAMSRYLYLDFALTALVAVSVAFLLLQRTPEPARSGPLVRPCHWPVLSGEVDDRRLSHRTAGLCGLAQRRRPRDGSPSA